MYQRKINSLILYAAAEILLHLRNSSRLAGFGVEALTHVGLAHVGKSLMPPRPHNRIRRTSRKPHDDH